MLMRNALLRAALVTLAVICAGLPAHSQDAAELVKQLQSKLEGLKTFSSDMTMKMNLMGMQMEYGGDVVFLDKKFVMNMNIDMMGQKIATRSVLDATGTMWTEVNTGGMKQVIKMDKKAMEEMGLEDSGIADAAGGLGGNPMDAVKQMLDTFDLTLEGKDTIDGVEVYRLSAEVKDELKGSLDPEGQMAQMGISPEVVKLAIGVEDGFPHEYAMLGADGSVVMQVTFTNVNLAPEVDPTIFDYSPPEGATVMDYAEMMKGMQGDAGTGGGAFEIGSAAPDFTGLSLAGKAVRLSDYKGKVVLVDFWATWCGPCVQELPNVIEAYKAYHDKGFEIVGVSLDESKEDLEAFLKDHPDMIWTQLFDGKGWDSDIAVQYKVEAIPFTLLLDKEGNVIRQDLRGEALSNALADLLGG